MVILEEGGEVRTSNFRAVYVSVKLLGICTEY